MFTRRRFLGRSILATLGVTSTALALPNDTQDTLPDGSASKGMITPETEQAIAAGLAYLRQVQHPDGGFGTPNSSYQNGNTAITALGGLAMMAGGHQPGRGAYGEVVTRVLQFILAHAQKMPQGVFLSNPNASPHGPMYGHGFAALFLAEVYGMVTDKDLRRELRTTLRGAVDLIVNSQNVEGGWRYQPWPNDADISVTICQIMALRAAKNAGFAIDKAKVDKCVEYVKRCQDRLQGSFRYQAQGQLGFQHPFARTAAGVVALYSAGVYKGPEIEAGLKYLMEQCKPGGHVFHHPMHYFYGHYYAAQAMWLAGGKYWQEWFPAVRDELLARRRPDGSWHDQSCTHYGTAMACIILQIPNNYLPILQK
jgi:hypothetical protein